MVAGHWKENMRSARGGWICVYAMGDVILGIELKIWREGRPDPLLEGLKQLDKYLSGLNLDTGWLAIFDLHPNLPPISDRTSTEIAQSPNGRIITVIRG